MSSRIRHLPTRSLSAAVATALLLVLSVSASLALSAGPAVAAGARSILLTQVGSLADFTSRRVSPLQIDAGTRRAYGIDHPSNDLVVYDIASKLTLARVPLGSDPVDVTVDSDTHLVYVSDHSDNNVTVIDGHPASPTANTIVDTLSTTGLGAQGIAVDEGSKTLYVANTDSSDLSVIDLSTGAVVRLPLGVKPDDVVVSSSDHRAYVSSAGSRVIVPVTGRTVGTAVASAATPVGLSLGAGGLVVSTTDGSENRVELYDSFLTRSSVSPALDAPVASVSSDGDAFLHYVVTTNSTFYALRLDTLAAEGDAATLPTGLSNATVDPSTHLVVATSSGLTASNLAIFSVEASPVIVSLTTSTGSIGIPFSLTAVAVGLPTTMTYSLAGGTLPPGLTLSAAGLISGTPTAIGSYSFTVNASNGSPTPGSAAYTITITAGAPTAPVITSPPPPNGTVGVVYPTHQLTASGSPTATFSITRGSLPPGLTLDERAFTIHGTPTAAGRYDFTVAADNGVGLADSLDYTVVIAPPTAVAPTITSGPPAAGTVGRAYPGFTVVATGSPAPRFSVTHGSLPPGLTLGATSGVISGTPTKAGRFAFTVSAINTAGQDSREYTLVVDAAGPTPTPTPTPTATPTPTPTSTPPAPTPTPSTSPTPGGGGSGSGGASGGSTAGGSGGNSTTGGPAPAGGSGRLASTGTDAAAAGSLGLAAVVVGGIAVAAGFSRRRRAQ